ncbi:hypothetical protein N7455_002463 [Penicillium solitum]|uniref:uncharacterized protein n=1 Tax=Penicillium solitum TaxID=60172 RepID=UPI0032C48CF8|nr:hypothetical protein N7455_002463 [Penicillium solitum]
MRNFITLAAFAAGSNALVSRTDSCCFSLTSSGGASGKLGQLGDGQNRIGDDSLQPAQYCIDSNGAITDDKGRGCILTPPTTQLQCDEGVSATPGFSINSQGNLEYNNSPDFVACATGQNGGLNVYTTPNKMDVTGCVNVQIAPGAPGAPGGGQASVPGPQPSAPGGGGGGGAPQPSPSMPAPSGGAGIKTSVTQPAPGGGGGGGTQPGISASVPPFSNGGASHPGGSASVPAPTGGGTRPGGFTSVSATTGSPQPPGSPSVPVTTGGGPRPTGSPTASVPASSASPTGSATGTSGGACATTLSGSVQSGNYETPHLIVPVDSSSPDTAAGSGLNGTVSSTTSTVFNFDIPNSDAGKTCSLIFLFPKLEDLETSSFSFSGDGNINFAQLSAIAESTTSFSNVPSVARDLDTITVSPGNSYLVSTFSCPAGQAVAYQMKNAGSTDFDFFEDWNPSPLGLFITTC